MRVMLLTLNGHLVNVHTVNSKPRAHSGNMCLRNVGNYIRLVQMPNGRHSASYAIVEIVG
jgi:hypothetical protein